jgi:hypothetical protein
MGLTRGQRVDFPLAMEEQGVFASDFREHLIRVNVDYKHASLLADEVLANLQNLLLLQLIEVLKLQRKQLRPLF